MRRSILTIAHRRRGGDRGAGLFGARLPAGFIPEEDQGILGVNVTLPPGASLERTSAVLAQVEDILGKTEGVESYQTVGGYGAVTTTYQPNFGTIFMRLKPWDERKGEELHVKGIMAKMQAQFARIPDAIIFPFNIPTISGFGASAGFNFLIQDRSGSLSVERLGELAQNFRDGGAPAAGDRQHLHLLRPALPAGQGGAGPREGAQAGRAGQRRLPGAGGGLGGAYVNDFNRFGRLYRVYVQAEADYRRQPEDIGEI